MSFINWIMSHQTVSASLGIAVLDFIFAVNPKTAASGVLHWLMLFFQANKDKQVESKSPVS